MGVDSMTGFNSKREMAAGKQEHEALAHPAQEPVGEAYLMQEGFTHCIWSEAVVPVGTKLYTTTPKREWVGLTDEEVWDLWNSNTEEPFPEWFVDFKQSYKTIESKLKERNHGA